MMKIGQRVKVAIKSEGWSQGAKEALDGLTGTIEEIREGGRSLGIGPILVRFDRPAPKWWTHQTPTTGFWFDESDLVVAA